MRRALVVVVSVVLGCGTGDAAEPTAPPPLEVKSVAWNASGANVGQVAAVAELGTSVTVFGSTGATVLTSGAPVASDASVVAWRAAGAIPSADGETTWVVGVDADGRLRRMHGSALEDVSDRFGLADAKVADVGAASGAPTAFLLDDGVALSDGRSVTRWQGAMHGVAAGAGRAAVASDGAVRVFDAAGHETDAPLDDATFVAFAGDALVAATHHAIYRVDGGAAERVWDAGPRTIHGVASSGANVWLAVDDELALFRDGSVAVTTGQKLATDARVFGSPSGDVWVVSGGTLSRWAPSSASGDEGVWTSTVQPVYARVCGNCHGPPGSGKDSARVDLSSYDAWAARRKVVYERVVTDANGPSAMPPPTSGFSLSDDERTAIARWAQP